MGNVTSVEPGFSMKTVLFLGRGINQVPARLGGRNGRKRGRETGVGGGEAGKKGRAEVGRDGAPRDSMSGTRKERALGGPWCRRHDVRTSARSPRTFLPRVSLTSVS